MLKSRFVVVVLAAMLSLGALAGCSAGAEAAGSGVAPANGQVGSNAVAGGGAGDAAPSDSKPGASAGACAANFDFAQVPWYTGNPYTVIADNVPAFTKEDEEEAAEAYAPLDELGRCGTAFAIVSREVMPAAERESIGMVKPSGWHTVRYDDLVDGKYLYNRCHLVGYQLAGENANERNLITGTRYMNTEGMLPFENEVAAYVERTGNRVLYRVTPVFVEDELVARGVHMEAKSIEDNGAGVQFNVFCYNVQPGVGIDYVTGESWREEGPMLLSLDGGAGSQADGSAQAGQGGAGQSVVVERAYVLNTNTKKFHNPGCRSVRQMKDKNKSEVNTTRDDLLAQGYEPCANCNP
ncbi:MAG: DNA/RNA non-specific endonuclease [Coriobacteriaceae bacterium]|nr:DNA/RNA non-specific endonuclease [Coriobacteriaceae bacterium]